MGRELDRYRNGQDKEMGRELDTETSRQMSGVADREIDRERREETDRQRGDKRDKQTDRETDRDIGQKQIYRRENGTETISRIEKHINRQRAT